MAEIERYKIGSDSEIGPLEPYAASDGPWVRYSAHLADKAAELERLADEFQRKAEQRRQELRPSVGAAFDVVASRLRERAAEIKEGRDGCSCGLKERRVSLQHSQRCPRYGNPEQVGDDSDAA